MVRRIKAAPVITARAAGLVGCQICGKVTQLGETRCPRCYAKLRSRDGHSLQKVWAWMIAGLIAYIPANIYPMLITTQAFQRQEATIVGGVIDLIHYGSYGVAAIVFIASVLIPVGKFLVIGYLAWILRRPHKLDPHRLHLFYEIVEFIGRWSMIDVFVVAILVALVRFGILATINPGIAAVCFALSVVFTMLAAQSFDSRLIWDRIKRG
ncbi:paraquat-inducible protein A [Actibacterium sp. 188UL27-1]|uniref:paraquat-inducible protein A n=1 Tax=Actibacterium sp. 188UL27-1 TaxID=2786961 RepID=UPI00195CC895|nr:paraquat-inducible protein A [Actibacterium sp. 188UL27-1]MBM7067260.1 paraquat-inducible protein A [Actibacterium sp. 188UL27-1]